MPKPADLLQNKHDIPNWSKTLTNVNLFQNVIQNIRFSNLSVVDHPSSIYKQQHVVDSFLHILSQIVQAARPGSQGSLTHNTQAAQNDMWLPEWQILLNSMGSHEICFSLLFQACTNKYVISSFSRQWKSRHLQQKLVYPLGLGLFWFISLFWFPWRLRN